ncbi:MAG: HpsJ family protein [Prochloraceae cyanobacterium]|nr:HpsJ family protein [Prochloraceae cyanobacterium]
MNSSNISPYTSLCLKIIGIIFLLGFAIDAIVLAIPFEALNEQNGVQWQIRYIVSVVDRGIVPAIGIALLLIGYWIDSIYFASSNSGKKSLFPDLRLPIFLFASFLGLIFLLFTGLSLINMNKTGDNAEIQRIEQTTDTVESRLQQQYDRLKAISENPDFPQQVDNRIQQVNQVLKSGQFQGQPLTQAQRQQLEAEKQRLESLKNLAADPDRLKQRLEQQQNQLRATKLETTQRIKTRNTANLLRISLTSLMLTIGYSAIGWLGLIGLKRMSIQ